MSLSQLERIAAMMNVTQLITENIESANEARLADQRYGQELDMRQQALVENERHNREMEVLASERFGLDEEEYFNEMITEHGDENITEIGIFDDDGTWLRNTYVKNDGKSKHKIRDNNNNWIEITLPKYDYSKTSETKNTIIASSANALNSFMIENVGVTPYIDMDGDLDDAIAIAADYKVYKDKGTIYSDGTIINEDLYRLYDNQYEGLGLLYAYDQDTPGYLGANDVEQARNRFNTFKVGYDGTGVLPEEDEAVLMEWGLLEPDESFIIDPDNEEDLHHNKDLINKLDYRASAFFEGVLNPENKDFFTTAEREIWEREKDKDKILIAESIVGGTIVQDLNRAAQESYGSIINGLFTIDKDEGTVRLLATGDLANIDMLDDDDLNELRETVNIETFNFLRGASQTTGGAGFVQVEPLTNDLVDGKVVPGSKLEKILTGLTVAGLDGARDNLVYSVNKLQKYNNFKDAGGAYVEGTVDDPDKISFRKYMLTSVDTIIDPDSSLGVKYNGMTPRDVILTVMGPLLAAGSTGEAQIVAKEIIGYLDNEMQLAQMVPKKYRSEFYDLLELEADAYGALVGMSK